MDLSRRRFFRKFVKPGEKSLEERLARYKMMDLYVQTELLPYGSPLTEEQQAQLFVTVRKALEETDDEELFSAIIRFKVDEVVDSQIRLWRQDSNGG